MKLFILQIQEHNDWIIQLETITFKLMYPDLVTN